MPDVISARPRRRSFVPSSSAVPRSRSQVPSGFLALRSAGPAWVGPGIVRALGTASVKFRASCLHLLASDPDDWRVRGLWINDRLVPGTEDLPAERWELDSTSPSLHGLDVEVGDEVLVEAEFARVGGHGFWNGADLSCWRPPESDDEFRRNVLSDLREEEIAEFFGEAEIDQLVQEHRAFRARCAEAAIRMSDAEAQRHVPAYQRWRDLARAGLVVG